MRLPVRKTSNSFRSGNFMQQGPAATRHIKLPVARGITLPEKAGIPVDCAAGRTASDPLTCRVVRFLSVNLPALAGALPSRNGKAVRCTQDSLTQEAAL